MLLFLFSYLFIHLLINPINCIQNTYNRTELHNETFILPDLNSLWPSDAIWPYRAGSDNGLLPDATKPLSEKVQLILT